MLPNFRKNEAEAIKTAPSFSANDSTSSAFPARPILAASRGEARAVSVIGADLTISGNLTSKGEVQVDGIVEGDINGSHVVVGETATITGGIIAEEVIVRGHVVGSVRSKRVMLQATSQVEGDIYHQALSIEQGAMFEGKSRRTNEDPRNVALPVAATPVAAPLSVIPVFVMPPKLPELPN